MKKLYLLLFFICAISQNTYSMFDSLFILLHDMIAFDPTALEPISPKQDSMQILFRLKKIRIYNKKTLQLTSFNKWHKFTLQKKQTREQMIQNMILVQTAIRQLSAEKRIQEMRDCIKQKTQKSNIEQSKQEGWTFIGD